ncbi:MAG: MFS transporter, partial [Halobacteria archaeon]|nr:MFS transporter [Halobacteria archaeon]
EEAGFEGIEGVPSPPSVTLADVKANLSSVLGERETWLIGTMLFCSTGTNITVFGLWGIPYLVQLYDVSVTYASTFTLLGGVGFVLGPPIIGWFSDRIGRRIPLIIGAGLVYTTAYGTIALLGIPPIYVVGVAFLVTGFATGGFVLGLTVMKERHVQTASGTAIGTVNGAGFLGAAVFPTLMGLALDAYWTGQTVAGVRIYTPMGYRLAFGIATVAGVIATVVSLTLYFRNDDGF